MTHSRYSFGDLSQTAVIRREALARLVPKLKVTSRLELTGRYLRVRGKLNTYKIHIGSGNILIESDDRYLCIVRPAAGTRSCCRSRTTTCRASSCPRL
jgi:hypothetical protein